MYAIKFYGIPTVGAGTAKVVTSTGDAVELFKITSQVRISRIMAYITTQVDCDTIAPVITVYRRPTSGSTSGQVALGTLTIPDGTAVSKVVYKDIAEVSLVPGDELAFNVSTAGTDSSSAAGAFIGGFEANLDPETAANQSNMVASA